MIEFNIDGNKYTYEQFKKDMTRMFDSVRSNDLGEANCKSVKCNNCPLRNNACPVIYEYDFCEYFDENISEALKYVKAVFKWAQEHPNKTNRDKLKELFGIEVECVDINNKGGKTVSQKIKVSNENDGFNACYFPNYDSLEFSMFETLKKWLDEKYK